MADNNNNQPIEKNKDKDKGNEEEEEHFDDAENHQSTKEEGADTAPKPINTNTNSNDTDKDENENDNDDLPPYYKSDLNPKKDDDSDTEEIEAIDYSPEEKAKISESIIHSRQEAGQLFKDSNYVQALNVYTLCLKDAKKAKITDQISILYCNRGICFNKLKEKDKALKNFTKAIEHNKNYSKAIANRFLLYYSKEDYMEAQEDYNRLKEIDKVLWQQYSHMENELKYKAEIKKKQMTDDMLGKLKDLGNSVLGNFGISLDNFKMIPNGQGGYSIQYQNK